MRRSWTPGSGGIPGRPGGDSNCIITAAVLLNKHLAPVRPIPSALNPHPALCGFKPGNSVMGAFAVEWRHLSFYLCTLQGVSGWKFWEDWAWRKRVSRVDPF